MSAPSGQAIALEPLPPQGPRKRKKKRKQKNPEETEIPINASGETTQPQSMWIAVFYYFFNVYLCWNHFDRCIFLDINRSRVIF